ncbi:MAG: hypothetical protein A2Y62_19465 [Candidatus Fischerbacteria bacterium RBG_13_37_8]|uniref:Uncharacterized protein n=1 Tax=Candidatus Fischerbacteria bacterium RBG_13_37_8 TaxID=1817863 RepID=A0A1F5VN42_9BACT|nr:MAG: hypothetical protein A2Y62_19465 [Candidatus Fischerbacteria bacterium RBG_13_37_8]
MKTNTIPSQRVFLIYKTLPQSIRQVISASLLVIGFVLQLKASVFVGSIFILCVSLLNLTRGIKIKTPSTKSSKWERATFAEYVKILTKIQQIKKWRGTSTLTKVVLIILYCFFGLPSLIGAAVGLGQIFGIIFLDFNLLFIPLFISGTRSIWIPTHIQIKVETLLNIKELAPIKGNPEVKIQPFLMVGQSDIKESFPLDAKIMIELTNAPKDFLGIQVQVSINTVGSSNYPYAYAVIIAKQTLNLDMKNMFSTHDKIVFEYEKQEEMDILVIRQFTTKTSGYHTTDAIIAAIIKQAFRAAAILLQGIQEKNPSKAGV